jgi:hypothetical protein
MDRQIVYQEWKYNLLRKKYDKLSAAVEELLTHVNLEDRDDWQMINLRWFDDVVGLLKYDAPEDEDGETED